MAQSASAGEPIEALVCDMDGLLIDSEPIAERAMIDFLANHGLVADPMLMARLLGRRLPEAVALVAEWYVMTDPLPDLVNEYDQMRTGMLHGNLTPMPGAAELIAYARTANLKVALATSNRRHQADISLDETGLAGLFDVEVTGDEVTRGKPEPDIFLLAAKKLGVAPARCVVLEDAPAGVAAADAAGMRSLAVTSAYSERVVFTVTPTAGFGDLFAAIEWLREAITATADV